MISKNSAFKSTLCGVALSMLAMSSHAVVPENASTASIQPFAIDQSDNEFAGRLIVKYKNGQSSIMAADVERSAKQRTGRSMKHLRKLATGAHLMELPKQNGRRMTKKEAKTLMLELQQDSNVEYVQFDQMMKPLATPNDPQYNAQWHYYESVGGLNLPNAWDSATGSGVVVAVIDTGYTSHPDLDANLLPGYDMISDTFVANDGNGRDSDASDVGDAVSAGECGTNSPPSNQSSSWHGTHVAGTVAAVSNNSTGVAGVAYDAKIVPVRVLGKCGGYTSDIADGIIWAAGGNVSGVPTNPNPAQVINLSLGGSGSCDATSQAAINQAVSLGATVVVAAGNSNVNASNATPANCNNVVTVASTNRNGGKAYYSNFGSVVDVAAPGGDVRFSSSDGILSTLNSGSSGPASPNYEYYQGTSMAAPHVAGAAALMYEADPSITPAEVESLLKSTARSFPATCSSCGSGIVDATAALAALGGGGNPDPGGDNELANGVAETGLSGSQGSEVFYTLEVPAGASNLSFSISGGSGDADIYVRYASAPTTGTYDCRPYLSGNNETCNISNVQAGTYHVMIRAYSSYSGVSLVGSFTEGGGGQPDSISETNLSGSQGQWLNFQIDVPSGYSSLVVNISGGSGDADLYVRRGAQPTTGTYDCRPYRNGNNETCTFNNPAAGTYYIRLRGYTSFSGVSLNANIQ